MKKPVKIFLIVAAIYLLSYIAFRNTHIETWQKNGHDYVIFPKDQLWVYYFFRPITYVDGKLTNMGFHIGPHE